jgi:flagellar basal-body rod protein FlgB
VSDNTISDSAVMSALTRELAGAAQRQTVAAGNLANSDVPGYKAQDVTFSHALQSSINAIPLTATHPNHMTTASGSSSIGSITIGDAPDLSSNESGNNVQIDRELLTMNKAADDFSAAQTVIAAKFRLVRYAINEGK